MRPRINSNHVGSSVFNSEVRINQRAYKRALEYQNSSSSITIEDVLDDETFKKFRGMQGVKWYHTMLGHTKEISANEAAMLLNAGMNGISVMA